MQQYLLAEIGDAGVAPEHSVRAAVLMSSSGASLLEALLAVSCRVAVASGYARTVCACLLGALYLDPGAFLYGGGPWRHVLGLRGLFNAETARATLTLPADPSPSPDPTLTLTLIRYAPPCRVYTLPAARTTLGLREIGMHVPMRTGIYSLGTHHADECRRPYGR